MELLKGVDPAVITKVLKDYWPGRLRDINEFEDLVTHLNLFATHAGLKPRKEPWEDFLEYLRNRDLRLPLSHIRPRDLEPHFSHLRYLFPLLRDIRDRIIPNRAARLCGLGRNGLVLCLLPPLCKAVQNLPPPTKDNSPTAEGLLEELWSLAYDLPKYLEPVHEVEDGVEPIGLDLDRPVPEGHYLDPTPRRKPKPVAGQYWVDPPYLPRAGASASLVARYLTERRHLWELAMDASISEQEARRKIRAFTEVLCGKHDAKRSAAAPQGPVPKEDLKAKLLLWAGKVESFTLSDLLHRGPKELRKVLIARALLADLVREGALRFDGEAYSAKRD